MSKNTNIEWCDDSVNPTSGCDGCELWDADNGGPCYAGNLHETRLAKSLPLLYDADFTTIRTIPGRMAKAVRCMDLVGRDRPTKPWLNGRRRKIFVGDLGDIFSADVSFDYLKTEIIDIANGQHGRRHDLLLLTKQPQRAYKFWLWLADAGLRWPDNVWLGTSITSRASLPRIKHLLMVPARRRYLSIEPLVEDPGILPKHLEGIDWIIVGGESDQSEHLGRSFNLVWARQLIAASRRAEIAAFIKQLGSTPLNGDRRLVLNDRHGGDWSEWPDDLRIRELPPEITDAPDDLHIADHHWPTHANADAAKPA